jgi:hypothetical protein
MSNMIQQDNELQLANFGEHLVRKSLVPEANARYYVAWVRKFLRRTPDPALSQDDRILGFVDELRSEGFEDWKVQQAERAVKMFFGNFQNGADPVIPPVSHVETREVRRGMSLEILFAAPYGSVPMNKSLRPFGPGMR